MERVGTRAVPAACAVRRGDRGRLTRLVAAVDVVGTTERFDLFWLQLADVVGFQHLEYVPSNTHTHTPGQRGGQEGGAGGGDVDISAALPAVWRNDEWAYGVIRAAQDERTACADAVEGQGGGGGGGQAGGGGGCNLTRRVKHFKSLSLEDGGRTRAGGRPPPSLYKLAEATPVGLHGSCAPLQRHAYRYNLSSLELDNMV